MTMNKRKYNSNNISKENAPNSEKYLKNKIYKYQLIYYSLYFNLLFFK